MIEIKYINKELCESKIESMPFEALSEWAKSSFPCSNYCDFELLKHIQKLCYFRYSELFVIDETKNIDDVSVEILNWLKEHNAINSIKHER